MSCCYKLICVLHSVLRSKFIPQHTHTHTEPHFQSEKQGPCWKRDSLPGQLGWALREAASGTKTCHARGSLLCCTENRWELPQTTGPFISPFSCTHKHTPWCKQQWRLLLPTTGPLLTLHSLVLYHTDVSNWIFILHLWAHAWKVLEMGIPKLKSRALHPDTQWVTCVLWAEGDLLSSHAALNPIQWGEKMTEPGKVNISLRTSERVSVCGKSVRQCFAAVRAKTDAMTRLRTRSIIRWFPRGHKHWKFAEHKLY